MGNPGAFHCSTSLQALTVFSLVAVFAADHVQGGDDGCSPFSCGHLRDILPPFRQRGDPLECGVEAYELGCTSSKATIHISTGTYYVTAINYTGSYFWVMDPNFSTSSSCQLPLWNHVPYFGYYGGTDSVSPPGFRYLVTQSYYRACFANCSRAVTDNSAYKPVACLSANNSHVYVWVPTTDNCAVDLLEPYCGYLANIPFGNEFSPDWRMHNASYADITQVISKGFTVQLPVDTMGPSASVKLRKNINICLNNSISYFKEQSSGASMNWTRVIFWSEVHFLECVTQYSNDHYYTTPFVLVVVTILSAIAMPKFFFVLCRFLLAPLAVWIFLAYKYWKTRIVIDAVEKFLRIQQMIGPARYAYTDIVAITSHFRDKLGQGGYGSVYKGVLLPGEPMLL